MRGRVVFVALLLLASPASAGSGAGTTAASFLRLGFGARAMGLAEAFAAAADDASALHYNPAGLAAARPGSELLVAHALHFQDVRYTQLGFVRRPWGLSVGYLSTGGLERRTAETARPEGSFGVSDLAIAVSAGRSFGPVSAGATVRLIHQSIDSYSGSAVAADLGLRYSLQTLPVTLGASLSNVGTPLSVADRAFPLPSILRLGLTAGPTPSFPAAANVQADLERGQEVVWRAGLEYSGFGPFALRAGYLAAQETQRNLVLGRAIGGEPAGLSSLFGLFMGIGIKVGPGTLDYALLPYGELGNSHRFSVGLRF